MHGKSRSVLLLLGRFVRFCLLDFLRLFLHLLLGKALGGEAGLLRFRLRRIAPSDVALQVFQQMLAGGFEFIPDQPQPKQPSAEGVFFVLRLGFDAGSAPLHKRLMGDGEAKLDSSTASPL